MITFDLVGNTSCYEKNQGQRYMGGRATPTLLELSYTLYKIQVSKQNSNQ